MLFNNRAFSSLSQVIKLRDDFAEADGKAAAKTKSVVNVAKTVEILKKQVSK